MPDDSVSCIPSMPITGDLPITASHTAVACSKGRVSCRAGRLALIRLSSPCQVHPVIATRWSGSLKGKTLLAVMVRCGCP